MRKDNKQLQNELKVNNTFLFVPFYYLCILNTTQMEGTRLAKVARQIQKDLNEIFQRQAQSLFPGRMVTATIVRVSPDLGVAKVFLSVFPSDKAGDTLTIVTQNAKTIRHELAQRVKQQFRVVPELIFNIDDSLDYIENIDRLLKQ